MRPAVARDVRLDAVFFFRAFVFVFGLDLDLVLVAIRSLPSMGEGEAGARSWQMRTAARLPACRGTATVK